MKQTQFPDWLPEEVQQKAKDYLAKHNDSDFSYILKRLVTKDCMITVFQKLEKREAAIASNVSDNIDSQVEKVSVWNFIKKACYETDLMKQLTPLSQNSEYTAYFNSISKNASKIAFNLRKLIKAGILLPGWANDPMILLGKTYSNYIDKLDDPSHREYLEKESQSLNRAKLGSFLSRPCPSLGDLLNTLTKLSELEKLTPPKYEWKCLIEGEVPKKKNSNPDSQTQDLDLFRKTLLIRKVSTMTQEYFGKPMDEVVATITSVALDLEVNLDSVRKIRNPGI